jgi:hypothetical protein
VQQVTTWILEGNSTEAIEEAITETWPGEQREPLIVAAMSALNRSATSLRDNAADWCLESLRFLYQKQVEIGEYAGAMRAVKQICDMALPKAAGPQAPPAPPNVNVQVNIADDGRNRVAEFAERVRAERLSSEPASG